MSNGTEPGERPVTFVLVHGGFNGGWCWRRVAWRLRTAGHDVFTPTHTGLGDRAHLLDESVGVDTFVHDIIALLETEELTDVVLVGHSLGGMSITGAADRVPDRIQALVYVDGLLVDDGQTGFDGMAEEVVEQRINDAHKFSGGIVMRPFAAEQFGVTDPVDAAWLTRRMTPQPIRAYRDTVRLEHPIGNGLPCTYIASNDPFYRPTEASRRWAQSRDHWQWKEIAAGHHTPIIAPDLLTQALLETIDG